MAFICAITGQIFSKNTKNPYTKSNIVSIQVIDCFSFIKNAICYNK